MADINNGRFKCGPCPTADINDGRFNPCSFAARAGTEPPLREDAIIKFRKIKRQVGEEFSYYVIEAGTPEFNSAVGF